MKIEQKIMDYDSTDTKITNGVSFESEFYRVNLTKRT